MSASPANAASGPGSVTPTAGGPPAPIQRKRPPPSIFNLKKKPLRPLPGGAKSNKPVPKPAPTTTKTGKEKTSDAASTSQPDEPFTDYPIFIERLPEDRDARFHTLKIHSSRIDDKGNFGRVDPYEESQFTRPVHLFRRNPNDKIETPELSDVASGVDDRERELIQAKRAERQAERQANQAQIAPSGGDVVKPPPGRKKKPQKKVEERIEHPKALARNKMLKEEARPWHLEDFDGKNKWVASYEAPMSKAHAIFYISQDSFRMIPLEKYYQMKAVSKLDKKLDSDTIEKQMQQKYAPSRWWRGTQADNLESRRQAALQARQEQRKQEIGSDDEGEAANRDDYQADVDEIDFQYEDEFQDDDEGFIFGDPDNEDAKDAQQKVREEMRTANLPGTGFRDEDRDWDAEEDKEKAMKRAERKKQKRMRRQLQRKELRVQYDSDDSDADLFGTESESEDSEEERERLEKEQKEKEEEARRAAQQNGDKSGASTKGTNTPTGRMEKKPSSSLKREADGSDLSGNESSRKRAKLNGRVVPSLSNAARSLSPDAAKRPSGYGSGSETDTSRMGRVRDVERLKNMPKERSRSGTPVGSRAQSPQRPTSTGPGTNGPSSPPGRSFPTKEEVRASIPPEGIRYNDLAKAYSGRVRKEQSAAFVAIVKAVTTYDNATKTLFPVKTIKP